MQKEQFEKHIEFLAFLEQNVSYIHLRDFNLKLNLKYEIFGSVNSDLSLQESDLDISVSFDNQDKVIQNESSKKFFENAVIHVNKIQKSNLKKLTYLRKNCQLLNRIYPIYTNNFQIIKIEYNNIEYDVGYEKYYGYEYAAWLEERSNFLAEQTLNIKDSRNVGSLWIGFLEYYSKFDWENLIVDIYSNKIKARESKTSKWFIKDPFKNRNLAEKSTIFYRVGESKVATFKAPFNQKNTE
ncbi:hypothetical protein BpHYR1_022432 [Brachionus plicatilis]|uniref:Uncharacterized protein n=1 Tax=Brachionus plicatilis TaxID=10195 RepID=A0A3M7RE43_BRAPC|nr:hypothetical protein BpHYR1_022432 [Brachionus plicatilis]